EPGRGAHAVLTGGVRKFLCFPLDVSVEKNVGSIKMKKEDRYVAETAANPRGRRKPRQLGLVFRTWGGKRARAGRKPNLPGRPGVPHRPRPAFARRLPVHVTVRMTLEVYNLRSKRSFRALEKAFHHGSDRLGLRLLRFSVQGNHIHLLV